MNQTITQAQVPWPPLPDLSQCIVHSSAGELIGAELAGLLDAIAPGTLHEYRLAANSDVELHRHDYDEYWWFTAGRPLVTLYSEAGGLCRYQLGPGDMVACLRGVAHTLAADHELVYFQFSSVPRPGARQGHLPVELSVPPPPAG